MFASRLKTCPFVNNPNFLWLFCSLLLATGCRQTRPAIQTPVSELPYHRRVDTRIGTGGHGHTYPGATSPFGMVQLSPDTRLEGWDGCGGYHADDDTIYGFSHTHLQGTGVSDYADILVMPCTQFNPRGQQWRDRYKSAFDRSSELGIAGHYQVHLRDHALTAQLTSTPRTGVHRYILDQPDTVTWIVDLAHRDALLQYEIYPLDDSTVVGSRISDNWARAQHVYFAMRFDRAFEWLDALSEMTTTDTLADGTLQQRMEYVPVFAAALGVVDTLLVRVALSSVDIEGALRNLEGEAPHLDFDRYVAENSARWDEQLGRIDIQADPQKDANREHRVFYTALYHACTTPNLASDIDGRYRGMDLKIHQLHLEEGLHYSVFSLWDTFRALHPLLNWLEPERSRDFVRTMLRMYQQGGALPVWELAANETDCMIGYHSVPVITDAVRWGIDGFNRRLAWEAMQGSAGGNELGLPAYRNMGFIPSEVEHESVSKTLEYAFDDACIYWFQQAIQQAGEDALPGDAQQAESFRLRALAYRNLFNPATGFIQPKRGGAFVEGFDPREVNFHYTEANGWQYHFFAPHDVPGLMEAMGGAGSFISRLEEMFEGPSETTGRDQADITGCIGQYAHGNEPSHHVAYLAAFAGRHDRTAEWVTQILDSLYFDAPDGLSGNEDCGQMSAWYLWSALGLYPVAPGSGELVSGTPRFSRAVIRPQGRAPVTLEREGKGIYVAELQKDGIAWEGPGLAVERLREGGVVTWTMSQRATDWGREPAAWPGEAWEDEGFVGVPILHAPRAFRKQPGGAGAEVRITAAPGTQVRYRLGEDSPWSAYLQPFFVETSCILEAQAFDSLGHSSAIVSHPMRAMTHNWKLKLATEFDNQYHAGGDQALLDGILGGAQFKTGEWQGYWDRDVTATVDLGQQMNVERLRLGALKDIRPWIYFPREVRFYGSSDGAKWTLLGTVGFPGDENDRDETPRIHRFEVEPGVEARYLRFEADTFGQLPDWHLGAGNPSWMFLDEWEIETAP